MIKHRAFIPVFLLILLSVIWGSSFILMKLGMFTASGQAIFSPGQVAALRLCLASLALFPFVWIYIRKIPRNRLLPIALVGIFGNGIPAFLFTAAEEKIDSSLAGMLNATTPVFAVLLGIACFNMRLTWINYIGVLTGFAGTSGLMMANGMSDFSNEWAHAALVLIATGCYALSVNLIRTYLYNLHPMAITSVAFSVLLIPAWCVALCNGSAQVLTGNPQAVGALGFIAILALVGTAFAVLAFNYLVSITNAVYASTVTYLMPVTSVIWGIVFQEKISWLHGVFIMVILAGVYLTNMKKKEI